MSFPFENQQNREAWLSAALRQGLGPLFEAAGQSLPEEIRIACSFPSHRGTAPKRRIVGECWANTSSKDGHWEIMISPLVADPMQVASILAHELVHVGAGLQCGHRGPFASLARKIGLEGPMRATVPGEAFKRSLVSVLDAIGPYPHGELVPGASSGPKKQTTRLVRCRCRYLTHDGAICGYTARTTRLWLDSVGAPHCPRHGEMVEG